MNLSHATGLGCLFLIGSVLIGCQPTGVNSSPPSSGSESSAAAPPSPASTSPNSATKLNGSGAPNQPLANNATNDPPPTKAPTADPPADGTPSDPPAGTNEAGNESEEQPAKQQVPPPADPADPDKVAKPRKGEKPFKVYLPMDEFPKDLVWLNTGGPLRKKDLKGKFVLLDFWTYCCINCLHILPELKKLEQIHGKNLIVIGVHSAKFDGEKDTKNIEDAILRYDIEHPVINDADHKIWDGLGVQSWPTILLIDPEGFAVWGRSGEFKAADLSRELNQALPYYRENGLLDETPIRFDLLAERQTPTPLRFPGKLLADGKSQRLFITDSNHHRIVISSLDGKLQDIIGSGAQGRNDGDFKTATFDHPQGLALRGNTLYVADTENHLLRKVDLDAKSVTTIAGIGEQARGGWPGSEGLTVRSEIPDRWVAPPKTTALNSPWDLWIHHNNLYIAMAGPHQIWMMPLDESEIGPYAGNGREDIVDGPLVPKIPYDLGYSSFAQPSGLTSDGKWLYVADSEGSSIRAVPFDSSKEVRTVVGTAHLRGGRLFTFGDKDGSATEARLQHALAVAYHDGQIYVADTYNNKIKVVNAATGKTRTLAGTGEPGHSDTSPVTFDEPAGLSFANGKLFVADTNSHRIRIVDPKSGAVRTLEISSLTPPKPAVTPTKPDFAGAEQVQAEPAVVRSDNGKVTLRFQLELPEGWKINALAPMAYYLEASGATGPLDRKALGKMPIDPPATEFQVALPVSGAGEDQLKLSLRYYYCEEGGEGICKVGAVVLTVPVKVADDAPQSEIQLSHKVQIDK